MPTDALVQLQPSVTRSANGTYSGSAVTLTTGTPRWGLAARVIYSAATNASGANSVTFQIDVSYDAGSTWFGDFVAADKVINLSTTAQSGEIYIPFEIVPKAVAGGAQVRLTAIVAGAGTSPAITYGGELSLSIP